MEGNFGGGKYWRIWWMTINLPKSNLPIFILDWKNLTQDVMCKHSSRKKLMLILCLKQNPCRRLWVRSYQTPRGYWVRPCHHWQLWKPMKKFQNSTNSSRMHMWHAISSYKYITYWRYWSRTCLTMTASTEISFFTATMHYLNYQVHKHTQVLRHNLSRSVHRSLNTW